jgi:preprotein translocase subunit SecA
MDQLRKGISLRAYGQVDPVISYKKEGYDMFDEMIARVQRTTISILLKVKIQMQAAPAPAAAPAAPAQPAQPAQPANPAPARPASPAPTYRRQMPEPLSNMSSSQNKKD